MESFQARLLFRRSRLNTFSGFRSQVSSDWYCLRSRPELRRRISRPRN